MARRTRTLTVFGKDLDSLLTRAGKSTIREYADECGVSYKYVSQLRTIPTRRPGKLYVDLLKPFVRVGVLGLAESQQFSLKHRGKPLSMIECAELFPGLTSQHLEESVKKAAQLYDVREPWLRVTSPSDYIEARQERYIWRHVFVGRQAELYHLRSAFETAATGEGRLVMIAGEPGIGKTALCSQFAAYVADSGGAVLVGHCSEIGISLPYLAFVEVLRSYVLATDANRLSTLAGASSPDLSRMVPEMVDKLGMLPRPRKETGNEKYRLMQAVTDFLTSASNAKPMMITLEDLQDADEATLEMLNYVSRHLSGARILLVGTYRNDEARRNDSLLETLAELRRLPSCTRMDLHGLSVDEVKLVIESITSGGLPWGFAEAIHRQTEGNPLFVQEMVRYLSERKLSIKPSEEWLVALQAPLEMSIPESLRDIISKRMSALSKDCLGLLSIAAVIGRDFRLDVLRRVSELSDRDTYAHIEEAKRFAIIEEFPSVAGGVTYRFSHALFRSVMYDHNIAPRRHQLHQQVAHAMEEVFANRLEEQATELAEHLSHSTNSVDLAKAIMYGELASQKAMDVYAYSEAVRLLQQTVKIHETLDPQDRQKRCDLLTALGIALSRTADYQHSVDVEFTEALSLAEGLGDRKRASNICRRAVTAIVLGGHAAYISPEFLAWAERANHYAEPHSLENAWASGLLGAAYCFRHNQEVGLPLIRSALEGARAFGDSELLEEVAIFALVFGMLPWSGPEIMSVAEDLSGTPGLSTAYWAGHGFLCCGDRERAEEAFREEGRAASTGEVHHRWQSMRANAELTVLDGRLDECVEMLERMIIYSQDAGVEGSAINGALFAGLRPCLYLGYADGQHRNLVWNTILEAMDAPVHDWIALLLAYTGDLRLANSRLERMLAERCAATSRSDNTPVWMDVSHLESAVILKHRGVAEVLLQRLVDNTLGTTGMNWMTCVARHQGAAAALLGRHEEALRYYNEATRICTDMRFRPELALTRLQLAELILEQYPDRKDEAWQHLDFAVEEFREMKMRPSLERALRLGRM